MLDQPAKLMLVFEVISQAESEREAEQAKKNRKAARHASNGP